MTCFRYLDAARVCVFNFVVEIFHKAQGENATIDKTCLKKEFNTFDSAASEHQRASDKQKSVFGHVLDLELEV